MVPATTTVPVSAVHYPESDGKPMSENTKPLRWIVTLYGNLAARYADREDVFVAGDNFWYPVEGQPEIVYAPDVYVVFGRPKGDRGSYKQWEENDIPLTVVFEVLSPGNTAYEMIDKQAFYEEYGVEEYYIYDPDRDRLTAYLRRGDSFVRQRFAKEFVSPRLKVRFDLTGEEMVVYRPDGRPFLTFEALEREREKLQQDSERTNRLMQRMIELNRKSRRQQATPEELAELERLERELSSASDGDAGLTKTDGV